ncbi:MAG: adenosylcobinamide-phosphate synthase CbiB [Pseudomonadales bacterium]|nr:adenosylcobinamide-phosphate synthase CbiB [Pseudomonadales bacterium]
MEHPVLLSIAILLGGFILDHALGEPKRFHPLVGFGNLATTIESWLNNLDPKHNKRWLGLTAWGIAILPIVLLSALIERWLTAQSNWLFLLYPIITTIFVYLSIGRRSLKEHMLAIHSPLSHEDLPAARQACAMIVSRDTTSLDGEDIAKASIESTLENGMDGIFGAIFWFCLLGIPGVFLYRLSNTLDAMWGYRNERFEDFGKWAARTDDVLNWIPARITALVYILVGFIRNNLCLDLAKHAFNQWRVNAPLLASPNGGPVMTTGATILNVRLGGPTPYQGKIIDKPFYGGNQKPNYKIIQSALDLVDYSTAVWLVIGGLILMSGAWNV